MNNKTKTKILGYLAFAGIWRGRDISIEKIRRKAWKKLYTGV